MSEFFRKCQRCCFAFLQDVPLLASMHLAQLSVWRILRRREKENTARRKAFRLIPGGHASPKLDGDNLSFLDSREKSF